MQKKLVVVAIAGVLATPLAFAQGVTISGRFADGFEQFEVSAGKAAVPNAGGYHKELKVSDQSSRIIFSGSEDLGGGSKAWFQLDNRFAADVGNSTLSNTQGFATGNTGVGLSGGWGKFTIGRWDLHYSELLSLDVNRAGSLQSLQSLGPMSQVNGVVIANGTRTSNVLMYDSNNLSGLTFRVAYSTAPFASEGSGVGADGSKGDALTGAVRWSSGPLSLVASYWTAKPEQGLGAPNPTNEQKSTRLGGGYTIAGVKIGLAYDSSEDRLGAAGTALNKRSAYMLPVSFAFGSNSLYFNYLKLNKLSGPGTIVDTGAKALGLGWDTALSKRTSVGVYYSEVKNEKNAAYHLFATAGNAIGEDSKQIYFGVAHNF
jgi:predicted porin